MLFGKRERLIRRILVVEDEPLVAFDNEYLLADAGYEVVATVDSPAAAREVIEREPLDLVLTDIRLAGEGDGTGVARIARHHLSRIPRRMDQPNVVVGECSNGRYLQHFQTGPQVECDVYNLSSTMRQP